MMANLYHKQDTYIEIGSDKRNNASGKRGIILLLFLTVGLFPVLLWLRQIVEGGPTSVAGIELVGTSNWGHCKQNTHK